MLSSASRASGASSPTRRPRGRWRILQSSFGVTSVSGYYHRSEPDELQQAAIERSQVDLTAIAHGAGRLALQYLHDCVDAVAAIRRQPPQSRTSDQNRAGPERQSLYNVG